MKDNTSKQTHKIYKILVRITLFVVVLGWARNLFNTYKEDKKTGDDVNVYENFSIVDTCWKNNIDNKYLCFDEDNVYNVLYFNGNYRKTNDKEDVFKYKMHNQVRGYYSDDDFKSYDINIKKVDDVFTLSLVYIDKDTTKRDIKNYNLASIKNSDINPVDYFVEVNLFNQKSFPSASNKFIDKFTNSFYDVFGSLEKRILLGSNSYKSGFRVIEDAKHQGVIYYANTSLDEVKTAIDNEDFEYMKQYQVCFSTDFLSKQEDTSIKLDINTKFIKIDYCNNFK